LSAGIAGDAVIRHIDDWKLRLAYCPAGLLESASSAWRSVRY
jgi:hypothetical protein